MATRPVSADAGSWKVVEELLERADPGFVDELRRIHNAPELGDFATKWYSDPRPAARRFLIEYLDRPLNAGRHEPLVKRMFKLAEAANDDEIMSRFLVCVDRSVRRQRKKRHQYDSVTRSYGEVEKIVSPSNLVMPKNDDTFNDIDERRREMFSKNRLFSVPTRNYLRRRAWRYFRKIGKTQPERYFAAMKNILTFYRDEDFADGLALIDNWGLIHILFHNCPALLSNPTGWVLIEGKSLLDVTAAPMYPEVWKADAQPLIDLLNKAPSRTVRQWAIQMLKREHPKALPAQSLEQLVVWLAHPSKEMVELAVELLKTDNKLATVPVEQMLTLLKGAAPETLEMLADLVGGVLKPTQVTVDQTLELAMMKAAPLAALGFKLLQAKTLATKEECIAVLRLNEALAEKLRPEMVRWSCGALSKSSHFQSEWVLEYLDCRHADVRAEGWAWLKAEPRSNQNVTIWQRLLESPYDDVRLPMVELLQEQTTGKEVVKIPESEKLDPQLVRLLWATVLLNVSRGARNKPAVVKQLVSRLDSRPQEAEVLLPLLTVALRSLRGPEFRAGLVAIVQLTGKHESMAVLVKEMVPEFEPHPAGLLAG